MAWRKLSVFSRNYDNGDVIAKLPLFARAEVNLLWPDTIDGGIRHRAQLTVSLGHVASDHVGYASFDLTRISETSLLLPELSNLPGDLVTEVPAIDVRLLVLPFADDYLAMDAMTSGDVTDRLIVARLELSADTLLGKSLAPAMSPMQDPGIDDWHLSPASFAANPGQLVGEEGCDQLYPANFATSQFRFTQIVRRVDTDAVVASKSVSRLRYGWVVDYRNEWLPIGHSLGRILYSLPLAPGEKVQLAIVDWRRTDAASRSEDTSLEESLDHSQSRDRTISEVVLATVRERQGGHSFMGGLASTVTGTLGYMNMGGSHALGFASTSSHGSRTISADTTQNLSDGFQQTSTAIRQLRSTVITQSSQAEAARAETRTVANYNHCHALTMMYYEVLHFHRVATSVDRVRPVLLVDFQPSPAPDLNDSGFVLSHRRSIEAALLDPRHVSGVQALAQVVAARRALADAQARRETIPPEARDLVFRRLLVVLSTGDDGTDNNVSVTAVTKNGQQVRLKQIEPAEGRGTPSEYYFGSAHDDFQANTLDAYLTQPDEALRWGDLRGIILSLSPNDAADPSDLADNYRLRHLRIIGFTDAGDTRTVLDTPSDQLYRPGVSYPEISVPEAEPGSDQPAPQLTDFISPARLAAAELLMVHLAAYREYYSAAILEDLDRQARWRSLDATLVEGVPVTDLIEDDIVGRVGTELAFPLTEPGDAFARKLFDIEKEPRTAPGFWKTEDLIGLPTRGVFAEAILGRCASCEKIDDSRFWDWQQSPVPGEAPAIAPVDVATRARDSADLRPSAMPEGIVNIAAPLPAPDPVAMANALQILGKGDMFRDMSGISQLGPFLSSLSESTAAAVSAAGGGRRDADLMDKILATDELTPEQKAELAGRVVDGPGAAAAEGAPSGAEGTSQGPVTPPTDQNVPPVAGEHTGGEPARGTPVPKKPTRMHEVRDRTIEIVFVGLGSHDWDGDVAPVISEAGGKTLEGLGRYMPFTDPGGLFPYEYGRVLIVSRKGLELPDELNLSLFANLDWSPEISSDLPPAADPVEGLLHASEYLASRQRMTFNLMNLLVRFADETGDPHRLVRVECKLATNTVEIVVGAKANKVEAWKHEFAGEGSFNFRDMIRVGGSASRETSHEDATETSQFYTYSVTYFLPTIDASVQRL